MPPAALPWWRIAIPLFGFFGLGLICRWRDVPLLQPIWRICLILIGYAMLQDQISVRMCPEYFTIGHPPIKGITNPTLLGIVWGFLGGFPGGIVLGIALAMSMYLGKASSFPIQNLKWPLRILLAGTAFGTGISGLSSWYNAQVVNISIGAPWNGLIPLERQQRFFIVANAHLGTYLSAAILGIGICIFIIYQRNTRQYE